jgi:protein-tyrosine sulfotransferase
MRYRDVANESRLDKLLSTRIRDLEIYFRKLVGLQRFPYPRYENPVFPAGFDAGEIESIARAIRGPDYEPAVFLHGVLARSGTNYLSDLIERHPDICAHPHQFWEFPLLAVTDQISELQNDFARVYRRNADVLKPLEFAACLGSGLLRRLQHMVGEDKTMLFKFPYVYYIDLFRILFPRDYLILLLRDGRDVVSSSMRSFKEKGVFRQRFVDYSAEWACAARAILAYEEGAPRNHPRTIVVRYEEVLEQPEEHVREIVKRIGLDPEKYDYTSLKSMPVRGSSDLAGQAGGMHWKGVKPPEHFKPVGRWKDWPQRKKRRFKAIAGEALIAAGYEKRNDW